MFVPYQPELRCFDRQYGSRGVNKCAQRVGDFIVTTACSLNTDRIGVYFISQTKVCSKFHKGLVTSFAFHSFKLDQKTFL